ncbi:MAG: hypothetical protein GX552_13450 [Chloroflexi bacterium]|nr:hypothetical protein [Chloroflexota bacterium]
MDCPKCKTYNPEDRTVCWRCDTELPKPKPEKKKDPQKTARLWMYGAFALFLLLSLLRMCGGNLPFGKQAPQGPTGMVLPNAPVGLLVSSVLALL